MVENISFLPKMLETILTSMVESVDDDKFHSVLEEVKKTEKGQSTINNILNTALLTAYVEALEIEGDLDEEMAVKLIKFFIALRQEDMLSELQKLTPDYAKRVQTEFITAFQEHYPYDSN